jgi:hypothetical protein
VAGAADAKSGSAAGLFAADEEVGRDLAAVDWTIRALFAAAGKIRLTIAVGTTGAITGTLLKVSGLDQIATVVTQPLRHIANVIFRRGLTTAICS